MTEFRRVLFRSLRVHLRKPEPGQSRNGSTTTPSGLEGGSHRNIAGMLRIESDQSLDRGTILHRWFEQVAWLDDPSPSDTDLRNAVADLDLPADNLDKLIGEFRAACDRPQLRESLCRASYATNDKAAELELWRERPFVVMVDGQVMQGQFDRVVLVRDAGQLVRADLVDYKTDAVDTPQKAQTRADHYRPQIRAYRQAIELLTGLPAQAITARLAFTTAGLVMELP